MSERSRSVFVVLATLAAVAGRPCAAANTACKDGWASITGSCGAESQAQKAIVAQANAAVGGSSGQSTTCTLASGCWLTDAQPPPSVPDTDGNLMRKALHEYFNWSAQNPKTRPSLSYLQNSVMAPILSHYTTTDAKKMAVQMTSFASPASDPTGKTKWTDNQVLAFVGIRKQCIEWAISTAIGAASGTAAQNYSAPAFSVSNRVRPGMGLYNKTIHAMLIIDILWKNNLPIAYQVAEANYPNYPVSNPQNTWSQDPAGQVPWLRDIHRRPTSVKDSKGQPIPATSAVTMATSNYIIVNYEPAWK